MIGHATVDQWDLYNGSNIMKILLSNDDGYQANGIVALYQALCQIADVEVIAPEVNNSNNRLY